MRRFLRSRGYAASGWGQGLNLGLREGVLDRAHEKLGKLWIEHGRSVSLIGWSLGGLYARELAKRSPELVRLVITLGSPFTGHPRATNAWRLYEFASGHRIDSHDFHGPMRAAPPVPTTSIWSPTDGVVSWRCSVETRRDLAENIVVDSSHLGLGAHPAALYAIADRLAQPEGHWAPFHRKGWRRLVYSDPLKRRAKHELHAHAAPTRRPRSKSCSYSSRRRSHVVRRHLLLVELADLKSAAAPPKKEFRFRVAGTDNMLCHLVATSAIGPELP